MCIRDSVCGSLVLVGLVTRLASVPLIIDILVAIMTTKVPILLAKGFWPMIHEARTDWSMLLGSVFLLLNGAGSWSLDRVRAKRRLGGTPGVPHSPLVQRDLRPVDRAG